MTRRLVAVLLLFGVAVAPLCASGQAGIYGVIQRVVLEPATGPAERIQIWGAFALIESMPASFRGYSTPVTEVPGRVFTNWQYQKPTRGYMYFKLPAAADAVNARREWTELSALAGTRQAVAFGYSDQYRGDKMMRIRDAAAAAADPDVYNTDIGMAKLSPTGNHAQIVADLLKLLER